jgi:hypothetical protein
MNLTTVLPKQQSLLKLAGAALARLAKVPVRQPRPRYIDIGEFSPHLQRDMGFLDGHGTPGPGCGPDARDLETRDWMR